MTENDNHLLQLSELDRLLAASTRIDEITCIRAKLEALRIYAVNIGESRETCNDFAMARIKAERKAGQVMLSLPKQNGARPPDTGFIDTIPQEIEGVLPSQRNSWQTIAKLPDDLFDSLMLERFQSTDDITTSYFYKAAKIHIMRQRGISTDRPYTLSTTIAIDATDMAKAAQTIMAKLATEQIIELINELTKGKVS